MYANHCRAYLLQICNSKLEESKIKNVQGGLKTGIIEVDFWENIYSIVFQNFIKMHEKFTEILQKM